MRKLPLQKNLDYRVRRSFGISAPRAQFREGQKVRYVKALGYSHYDAASVFLFEELVTGQKFELWFFDDDPESIIDAYFEPLAAPTT